MFGSLFFASSVLRYFFVQRQIHLGTENDSLYLIAAKHYPHKITTAQTKYNNYYADKI